MANSKLLTVKEVAARLLVHPVTVYNWLETGMLKGLRAGGHWRITEEDLKAFLNREIK